MQPRWKIHKLGLLNFWYYDEEELIVEDGKLLLRGANGSGKSVTMQSFIPLLLDGNKSPERLDPFGSKSRRLENYLLDDNNPEETERIAYLYIEFRKKETNEYATIGMGMKAVRGKPLESWGFVIKDGRRIGQDIKLYKQGRILLTKKELENRIASGGRVCEGQREYMKEVNQLLFGYEDIEEYDELIRLIIQLRSPKLSKDFRPTVIYEIMNNALKQLTDEDLRPMAEAIDNMDHVKNQLETLKECKDAADKIKKEYDAYNQFQLYEHAKRYVEENQELLQWKKEKLNLKQLEDVTTHKIEQLKNTQNDLKIELENRKQEKSGYEDLDSIKLYEEYEEKKKNLIVREKEREEKNNQLDKKEEKEIEVANRLKDYHVDIERAKDLMDEYLDEIEEYAEECSFDEITYMKNEINASEQYDFNYSEQKLAEHRNNLKSILKKLEQKQKLLDEEEEFQLKKYNVEKRKNRAELDKEQWQDQIIEEIDKWKESVYLWHQNNQYMKIEETQLQKLMQVIENWSEDSNDSIGECVNDQYRFIEDSYIKKKQEEERLETEKRLQLQKLDSEIDELKKAKEVQWERSKEVQSHRKALVSKGIPHIPFYKAIDFADDLDEEEKNYIEKSLIEMGMMDALIIPEQYKTQVLQMEKEDEDKYIFGNPILLGHTLSEFIRVDEKALDGITPEVVYDVIESMVLMDDGTHFVVDGRGYYQMGMIHGKVTCDYQAKYIGQEARKRHREEKLNALYTEKYHIETQLEEVRKGIKNLEAILKQLKKETTLLPSTKDVKKANDEVQVLLSQITQLTSEIGILQDEIEKVSEKIRTQDIEIVEASKDFNIPKKVNDYEHAVEVAEVVSDLLKDIILEYNNHKKSKELYQNAKNEDEDIQVDMENIRYEINKQDQEIRKITNRIAILKEQLSTSDLEKIKEQLERCLQRLDQIPQHQIKLAEDLATKQHTKKDIQTNIITFNEKIQSQEDRVQESKGQFSKEYDYGFVWDTDLDVEDTNLHKEAKKICKQLQNSITKNSNQYVENLTKVVTNYGGTLRDYNLKQIEQQAESTTRYLVTCKLSAKEVGFYDLLSFIEISIKESENILQQKDRELFEDILVNNMSRKIRAKIWQSKRWVEQMNELMESMDSSSGLSFSLRWRPKKTNEEDELGTKELVELLEQESSFMKPSDIERLSKHFMTKIEKVRKIQSEQGNTQGMFETMKEVLDYRQWYEFILFYTKTNESKKELTNSAFFQQSGGEKAMAMYVPLFSAVYARYANARDSAPRVISLDEAFAGVDEKNIAEMFRLVQELELDYIINSQVLWGDYETVPHLDICELLRPHNEQAVTVLRYRWNGKDKELVI